MIQNEQKIKTFIQKLKDENKELKAKTIFKKSQVEEFEKLKKMTNAQETTKRKWVKALFHYK